MFVVIMIMLASIVSSQPSMQPPHLFYGSVTVNGQAAGDGVLVVAKIDDTDVGFDTTADSNYNIVVSDPYGDRVDQEVEFYIGGEYTGESAIFSNEFSAKTNLNLDIEGDLFCGDFACGASESCSTCSIDCGACASSSSGGGGGGGGGAVVVQEECVPDWECTDWLDCTTGVQKRACIDANKCEGAVMPELERACEIPEELKSDDEEIENEPFSQRTVDLLDDTKPTGLSAITGAVVSNGGFSILGLVVVLAGIVVFLIYKKKK